MTHLSRHTRSVPTTSQPPGFDIFRPLRRWIKQIKICDRRFAHLICRLIPDSCPFERDVIFFGRTIHIPALCRLNPLYNEIVDLRLRALSYLTDICGEDATSYIH